MASPGLTPNYPQGIIVGEVGLTVLFFVIFQMIYYIKWGYDEVEQSIYKMLCRD